MRPETRFEILPFSVAIALSIVLLSDLAVATESHLSIQIEISERSCTQEPRELVEHSAGWKVNIVLPAELYGELYFSDVRGRSLRVWTSELQPMLLPRLPAERVHRVTLTRDDVSRAITSTGEGVRPVQHGSFTLLVFPCEDVPILANAVHSCRRALFTWTYQQSWFEQSPKSYLYSPRWLKSETVALSDSKFCTISHTTIALRQKAKSLLHHIAQLRRQGEYEKALLSSEQVIIAGFELLSCNDVITGHEVLALAHMIRGSVFGEIRDCLSAVVEFRRAAQLLERILQDRPTVYFMECLSISRGNVGELCLAMGEFGIALKSLNRASLMIESIILQSTCSEKMELFRLRNTVNRLAAEICCAGGGEEKFNGIHEILRHLSDAGKKVSPSRQDLIRHVVSRLSYCELTYGDIDVAMNLVGNLLRCDFEQYRQDPSLSNRWRCGTTLRRFAEVLLRKGRPLGASRCAEMSVEFLDAGGPQVSPQYTTDVSVACLFAAAALIQCRQFSDAEVYAQRARVAVSEFVPAYWGRNVNLSQLQMMLMTTEGTVSCVCPARSSRWSSKECASPGDSDTAGCAGSAVRDEIIARLHAVELSLRQENGEKARRSLARICEIIPELWSVRRSTVEDIRFDQGVSSRRQDLAAFLSDGNLKLSFGGTSDFWREFPVLNTRLREGAWYSYFESQLTRLERLNRNDDDDKIRFYKSLTLQRKSAFDATFAATRWQSRVKDVPSQVELVTVIQEFKRQFHYQHLEANVIGGGDEPVEDSEILSVKHDQESSEKSAANDLRNGFSNSSQHRVSGLTESSVVEWFKLTHSRNEGDNGVPISDQYVGFVLTPDGEVSLIELGESEEIDRLVRRWRREIQSGADDETTAQRLRELVWAPIEQRLGPEITRVYICPDGELTALPWAALPGTETGEVVLDRFSLAVVPYASMVSDVRSAKDRRGRNTQEFSSPSKNRSTTKGAQLSISKRAGGDGAALGDQVFGARTATEQVSVSADSVLLDRSSALLEGGWLIVGDVDYDNPKHERPRHVVQTETKIGWEPLPHSRDELETLAHYVPPGRRIELSGPEASRRRVLEELPRARWAHLATHGFVAGSNQLAMVGLDNPDWRDVDRRRQEIILRRHPLLLSGLVLAGGNHVVPPATPSTPGADRPILSGEDVAGLSLDQLELVVLSSCESGMGELMLGEGVFGLQRAFHLAGAKNVVASLWQVDDQATAALMKWFYFFLFEEQLDPLDALRHAQLTIRRQGPTAPAPANSRGPNFRREARQLVTQSSHGPARHAPTRLWAGFLLSGTGE